MPLPTLPTELLVIIIQYLADDHEAEGSLYALRSFCLTNKQAVDTCRRHLFSTIKLLGDQPNVDHRLLERFLSLLNRNPSLGSYVQDLGISYMLNASLLEDLKALRYLNTVQTFTFGFSGGNRYAGSRRQWSTVPAEMRNHITSFVHQNPISSLVLFGIGQLTIPFLIDMHHLKNLTAHHVTPGASSVPSYVKVPSMLKSLKLGEFMAHFTKPFISSPSQSSIFDISNLTKLSMRFHFNESTDVLNWILPLPTNLKSLKLSLDKDFGVWSCSGNILSILQSSSMASLKSIKLRLSVSNTPTFSPFGGFIQELERVSGINSLEDIDIDIVIQLESYPDMDPAKWNRLDEVLSSGFPHLRKLNISTLVAIFFPRGADIWEEAAQIQRDLEILFAENFHWSRKNLVFTTLATGQVI
ncbi:hypothetical protein CPB83DRAFT_898109 [Crepidotus variabilis]|uniref:Uncharacterized protein n=1 Tax=Crepidotus variabilis TaxID=179855 RepID=A0A9P6JKT2_9AGAR|nr:hypothetical protein CPB83DRAFT_898109 [Crepidotus variabilis]